jgi:hypothetical protein
LILRGFLEQDEHVRLTDPLARGVGRAANGGFDARRK